MGLLDDVLREVGAESGDSGDPQKSLGARRRRELVGVDREEPADLG